MKAVASLVLTNALFGHTDYEDVASLELTNRLFLTLYLSIILFDGLQVYYYYYIFGFVCRDGSFVMMFNVA